ncbi:MAG: helix-turn-helix domain-containing protein, partial [Clostridiales bacterium]|nr:helix-turn-helix domain-containing protein [Clostridiales bacterium]
MNEVSESIIRGLQEMLDHAQGKIELRAHYVAAIPPEEYTADEIKDIRNSLHMSQGLFAEVLGVSRKTVASWEYARVKPSGAARRLITMLQLDPELPEKYGIIKR